MSDFLTAAEALFLTPFTAGLILAVIYAVAYVGRRDKAAREAARADARRASLTYWRDTNPDLAAAAEEAWEDDPRFRADIARTRTQQSEQTTLARCPLCGAWPGQAHGVARPCRFGGAA